MRPDVRAVVAWIVAVPVLALWAVLLRRRDDVVLLTGAEPFVGHWAFDVGPGTLVAAALLVLLVRYGPRVAERLPWRGLLVASWVATAAWAVALAASVRWSDLTAPAAGRHEYLPVVPVAAADPAAFWSGFTGDLLAYPIHVKGHPPGLVLLLAGLERAGLGGPGWATALFVLAGASAVPAVLITLRRVVTGPAVGMEEAGIRASTPASPIPAAGTEGGGGLGESLARRAVPAMVLAPAALWVATSADALFAAVLAWGVALLAVASSRSDDGARPGRGGSAQRVAGRTAGRTAERTGLVVRAACALGAGVLLGACPFLSYGLLHMGALALAVPFLTRRVWPTVVAGLCVVGAVVAGGLAGFWLWDGIAATRVAWAAGAGTGRPYLYFLLVDLAMLGALIGPAGIGGLARLRRLAPAARWLVLTAVAVAVAGALTGFERGEVERIWLPVAYWIVPAAAVLGSRGRGGDRWLWAQGGAALLLEIALRTPW